VTNTTRGVLISLVAAFFGAAFLIPYQAAVTRADRGSAIAATLLCAAIFNTGVAAFRDRPVRRPDRVALYGALFLTVTTIAGNLAIAVSLPQIGAGMTSVVLKAQVVLTPLLAWVTIGERVNRHLALGVVVAGLGFLAMQHGRGLEDAFHFPTWALVAALVFAAMQVGTRTFVERVPVPTVNALRLWIAAGVLYALPTDLGGGAIVRDEEMWLYAAAAGVIGPGLSRLGLMFALRYVTPSMTALVGLVSPVFAFLLAYLAFGDVPTPAEIAGAVLILAGVAWPVLRDRPS
jgi:O-acetylserine/cysteine efflux transporter